MKLAWNRLLETLLWVRFGQELGSHSPLSIAVYDAINFISSIR
jgi:hypothetical protein